MESFDIRCKDSHDCDADAICIRPSESNESVDMFSFTHIRVLFYYYYSELVKILTLESRAVLFMGDIYEISR